MTSRSKTLVEHCREHCIMHVSICSVGVVTHRVTDLSDSSFVKYVRLFERFYEAGL